MPLVALFLVLLFGGGRRRLPTGVARAPFTGPEASNAPAAAQARRRAPGPACARGHDQAGGSRAARVVGR
jgi:hypothetical protein